MKKNILFITTVLLICFSSKVYAYETYKLSDYVFFDPVSDKPCNESNYWTIYNQDTTCYRFFNLNPNDDSNNSTLKVILDHDLAFSTFDTYGQVLEDNTKE